MKLTKKVTVDRSRGERLVNTIKGQFNMLHSMDYYDDYEIEKMLLKQKELELHYIKNRFEFPKEFVQFSPSGADKCSRELFYKVNKATKDEQSSFPYQKRWTRNSSFVHEAVQRDLLYMEKMLPNPAFKVGRITEGVAKGLPAWEKNIQKYKVITWKGVTFVLYGMVDAFLDYKDGSRVGFEYKTKSVSVDRVSKLKTASISHKKQAIGYSLLFSPDEIIEGQPLVTDTTLDEYIIFYESVAKDEWRAGSYAADDMKAFYLNVTEKQKITLLDKMADVAARQETGEAPDRKTSKCMFCNYKTICLDDVTL